MPRLSAGILPYRRNGERIEVLLVHPGGPFWARKDLGAWSIAKGEYLDPEPPLDAAIREFTEETGHSPTGPFVRLNGIRQPGGKQLEVWITEDDWDLSGFVSNSFSIEWPKASGSFRSFPEVDKVEWMDMAVAAKKILPGQLGFLHELHQKLTGRPIDPAGP